jgi:beta-N-acetylhexosaminidase
MAYDVLGIGLTGKTLTALERRILKETTPYAVVLFGRNIGSEEQFVDLVAEVKSLATRPPIFMIDEEGGRVDRLRNLVRGLPSVEFFGEGEHPAEMSEWAGKVIGMALRWFDVEVDLAPVVDIGGEQAPKGVELAGAFLRGAHGAGVATCLKHWPGIGIGSADPHYGATIIDVPLDDLLHRDIVPFQRLGTEAGAIMIGHGLYPKVDDSGLPASLSWRMTTDLLRNVAGFDGIAISDDMEMHAVSDLGSYEHIAEHALLAGNDNILFCSHIERVPDIQRHLAKRAAEDPKVFARMEEASARCEAYRAHCERLRAASPRPKSWNAVIDEAVRFVEELERTRPHREKVVLDSERRKGSRDPGKGRTGREEWT